MTESTRRPPNGGGAPPPQHSAAAAAPPPRRSSADARALSPHERLSRSSAEFVVNLGPPEPISAYASTDLESALGAGGAAARQGSRGADGGADGDDGGPPTPPARPDLLASIDESAQMTLRFARISAFVSAHVKPPGPLERLRRGVARRAAGEEAPPEERQILFDVTGEVAPGEVLALMGPSGSGKTSLLSVISGRAPRAVRTAGRVTVNGGRFSKRAKRRVGFVLQDDLLYETLTVEETLGYAAALRLPRATTAAERRARVDDVIAALGLGKCRGTIVGGFFRRGISGGERKRVSIGHELLINPSILMLDEPTSGLDSTTALHLLQLLQDLAAGGRSIATTIHQPSSRLYQRLDRLMLLADGHVVYYGGAAEVLAWFGHLGFACPYGTNVADFLLDLAQGEVARGAGPGGGGGGGGDGEGDGSADGGRKAGKRNGAAAAAAAAAAPAGDGNGNGNGAADDGTSTALVGPRAVRALWATYEDFARSHRQGFAAAAQLDGLELLLEPRAGKGGLQSVAELDSAAAAAAGGGGGSSGGGGALRVLSSIILRRSSGTGGGGSGGGGGEHADGDVEGGAGDDGFLSGTGGADPDTPTGLARQITRAFSRSPSSYGGARLGGEGGLGEEGGCCAAAAARVQAWTGTADRGGASYWTQLRILTLRQLKVRRFESLSGQRFTQLLTIAVLTGLFWWQRGGGGRGAGAMPLAAAGDVVGLLFFELLFPSFQALFSALFLFPAESKMLTKERASGMYRVSAFYASTVAADLPMDTALPALFCVVIYLMGGLRLTAGAFFANVFAMVLVTLTAQSWGLLLGAVFMNPKTAQTCASIMMLSFMLVGGFYVRDVPVWIRWSKYLSFVYWGFNLLLKVEFAGRALADCGGGGGGTPGAAAAAPLLRECRPVADVRGALNLPTDPNESPAVDLLVLFANLIILRLGVYVALRKKTKTA